MSLALAVLALGWFFAAAAVEFRYETAYDAFPRLTGLVALYAAGSLLVLVALRAPWRVVLAFVGAGLVWFCAVMPVAVITNDCVTNPWENTHICGEGADALVGTPLSILGIPAALVVALAVSARVWLARKGRGDG